MSHITNNILDKKYPNRFKYLDPEEKSDIDAYMQGEYVHVPDKNTLIQSLNTSLASMRQEQKQQYNFRLKVQDIDTIKSYAKKE